MFKILMILLVLFHSSDVAAKAVKLGDQMQNGLKPGRVGVPGQSAPNISCVENDECPFDKECVTLQCVSVCRDAKCPSEKYCAPAGKDKPHEYKCVECVINRHCGKGNFCDKDNTCKKVDPCLKAVCSPAAPFCMPKPYKTLPYMCVQCLTDEHCPPVAGLTRKCVDGYCLFNIKGNIPQAGQNEPQDGLGQDSVEVYDERDLPPQGEYYDEEEYYEEEYY